MSQNSIIEKAKQIQADQRAKLMLNDRLLDLVPQAIQHLQQKLGDGTITGQELKLILDRIPTPPAPQETISLPAGLSTADKIALIAEKLASGEIGVDSANKAVRTLQSVVESQQLRLLHSFITDLSKPHADIRQLTAEYLPRLRQFTDNTPIEVN
jgi:hypothetical protein